ncbi:cilia- and flagella-associated protein 58-like isoform X2 [Dendronephthya gigantea]|uniref:cilia- and flagella-associated protein 58-like isoform X2 n=1 Tax=Dendronephthya gigantea TaxID=151771 RepID=UPI00106BC28A|nr:cilia- and flagella-associated protein 58-like isoform X2 [Dendronephthya gigantea]
MQMGEGYDPDRFVDRVLHGFKCCICQCVLNEPRLCEAEEHKFCLNCISQHLPNSQTCPECRQNLTLETLKCPGKHLQNLLSELRIQCDYINRGCPEHVELGNLQNHVSNCEYRPVTCEECHLEVNAKDKDNHKKSFCQLGGANIQGLKNIKMRQEEMKDDFAIIRARQKEFDDKQKELEETQDAYGLKLDDIDDDLAEMEGSQKRQKRKLKEIVDNCEKIRTNLDEMEGNQNLQRQELNEVTNSCEEIQTFTNTVQDEMRSEVTGIKTMHSNIQKQVKKIKTNVNKLTPSQAELKYRQLEMARKQDQMEVRQDETKKALDEMKQTQSGINEKVEKMEIHVKIMQMGEGYDPDRFVDRVLHGFKCCICQCVLNEPRLCEAEEHKFCLNCISQHLPNSQTCPECRQHLTLETLKCPGNYFNNILSELRIKCEYMNRGCPEHVELGNLQNHVNNCEYRPVTCEECHLEVNAKDEDNHKKSFCQLGGANIQGLKDIKLRHEEMKDDFKIVRARQKEFDDKQRELEETQNAYGQKVDDIDDDLHEMVGTQKRQKRKLKEIIDNCEKIRTNLDEMEDNQNLQRQELNEVTNSCEEIQTFTNTVQDEMRSEVTGIKTMHSNIQKQVKKIKTNVNKLTPSQSDLKYRQLEMARKQDQMEVRQDETKKALDEMKQTQSGINEKVQEMEVHHLEMARKQDETKKALDEMKQTQSGINEKVEEIEDNYEVIKQQLERLEGLLGHLFQENIVNRNGAQATDPTIPTNNQDVIILGGWYTFRGAPPLKTVEKYNIVEKRSTMLPPLNHPRVGSASCVYNNDVLLVGGHDGKERTDTIEVLKMNQHPLRWTMFDGKLPVKIYRHDVIVYQGKLYIIGGYDWNERKISNAIHEIALTPPCTAKLLTRMPGPRQIHRAELVNGKLFILGGTTYLDSEDALDSVVVYDFIKNEFKPCPSLPQPVCHMSTVTWGDKIIVLGGVDKNYQELNDVIMYDTETGQIEQLPSMIYKRRGSSAVIMNDVIVVFGGWNDEQGGLNSVETFTIGGDGWKELPGMIEKRFNATAVVKPHI